MFDFCVYLRESQEFLSTSNIPSSSNSDSMLANRLVVEKYENLWERYRSIEVILIYYLYFNIKIFYIL